MSPQSLPEPPVECLTAGEGRYPVVLLHGNFATARWWRPLLDRPPKGLSLLAPTLPGFGARPGPWGSHTVHAFAASIRALALQRGLKRFHLAGHSLGGAVALQYALQWPESLHALSLVAPAPGDGLEAMRSRSDLVGWTLRWTDPRWASSRMALFTSMRMNRAMGTMQGTLSRALARMMPTADPSAVGFDQLLADALAIDERVLIDVYESLRRWDVRPHLGGIAVPVHILAGADDAIVSVASLQALQASLPDARLDV